MTIKIGILGCGPAGLLAAHAVASVGFEPVIFSRKVKSYMTGAQFMHAPVPGITPQEPEGLINFEFIGSAEGYREKVYGPRPVEGADNRPDASWATYAALEAVPAWNVMRMYDRLWSEHEQNIVEMNVTPEGLASMLSTQAVDLVMNSIPLRALCVQQPNSPYLEEGRPVHTFPFQEVNIHARALMGLRDFTVVYNGVPDMAWYRQSKIFGDGSTEYSTHVRTPPLALYNIRKPIKTNCDCWPAVVRLGRYGSWSKGVLLHHAFLEAAVALHQQFDRDVPGVDIYAAGAA